MKKNLLFYLFITITPFLSYSQKSYNYFNNNIFEITKIDKNKGKELKITCKFNTSMDSVFIVNSNYINNENNKDIRIIEQLYEFNKDSFNINIESKIENLFGFIILLKNDSNQLQSYKKIAHIHYIKEKSKQQEKTDLNDIDFNLIRIIRDKKFSITIDLNQKYVFYNKKKNKYKIQVIYFGGKKQFKFKNNYLFNKIAISRDFDLIL